MDTLDRLFGERKRKALTRKYTAAALIVAAFAILWTVFVDPALTGRSLLTVLLGVLRS